MYNLNQFKDFLFCTESLDDNALQKIIYNLEKSLDNVPTYDEDYFIVDTKDFKISFFQSKYIASTGFGKDYYNGKTLFDYYSRIHKNDLELLIKFFIEEVDYCINQHPKKCLKNLIFQTTYRFKNKWNRYIFLIEQMRFIETNKQGKPLLLLIKVSSIDNYLVSKVTGSIKLLNGDNKFITLIKKVLSNDNLLENLSKREYEVVDMLANGNDTKSIADSLSISITTVDTHRRNILKKLNLHSTNELIAYVLKNS